MTDSIGVDVNHKHRSFLVFVSVYFDYLPKLAGWLASVDSIDVEHGHKRWGKGKEWGWRIHVPA